MNNNRRELIRKILPLLVFILIAACVVVVLNKNSDDVVETTENNVEEIVERVLPVDEWREPDKWLQLDNGNIWVLTRQTPTIDGVTNPCAAKNNCPVESWIVNPTDGSVYLSSGYNSYLANIEVTPEGQSDGYLALHWHNVYGDVSQSVQDFVQYVNEENGSLK